MEQMVATTQTRYTDSFDAFLDVQRTRIRNRLTKDTRSEQINRQLEREALLGVDFSADVRFEH